MQLPNVGTDATDVKNRYPAYSEPTKAWTDSLSPYTKTTEKPKSNGLYSQVSNVIKNAMMDTQKKGQVGRVNLAPDREVALASTGPQTNLKNDMSMTSLENEESA